MFDIEFAYTGQMQTILTCFNFVSTFAFHSIAAMIILGIYGEKVSRWRIVIYAFFAGTVLNNLWTYSVYLLGGQLDFDPLTYALVTVPNPIFALLYYLIGFKALQLSPIRSIRLMGHAYLYVMSYKSMSNVIAMIFFPQQAGMPFNYLLNLVSFFVTTAIGLTISLIILFIIRRKRFNIELRDSMVIRSVPFELMYSFAVAILVYSITVVPQIFMTTDRVWGSAFSTLAIIMVFLMDVFLDVFRVQHAKLQNKNAYISSLVKSIGDFRALKHDYNNILQSYGGYIEIRDYDSLARYHMLVIGKTLNTSQNMELSQRLEECPSIISLLMQKLDYADELGVDCRIQLFSKLEFDERTLVDMSRCIGCLMDNAIEAAAESERKRVAFSWETKANGNKLLVVTNSTKEDVVPRICCEPGFTTRRGHSGLGLVTVRKAIDKYAHYSLSLTCYQNEFSAFIEILQT